MSSISNILQMALLLNGRNFVKYEEICNQLEVSEKQARRYRLALDMSGIFTESKSGPNGGVRLMDDNLFLPILRNLSPEQRNIIDIISNKSWLSLKEQFEEVTEHLEIKSKYAPVLSSTQREFLIAIQDAINNHRSLIIDTEHGYSIYHNKIAKKMVDPYFLFTKYNLTYLVALDHSRDQMIRLRLDRLQAIEVTDHMFEFDQAHADYVRELAEDNAGVYQNGEFNNVEMEVSSTVFPKLAELFEARVTVLDESEHHKRIVFTANNQMELIGRILSLGSKCKVLRPTSLVKRIAKEINLLQSQYETTPDESLSSMYYKFNDKVKNHLSRYVSSHFNSSDLHPVHKYVLSEKLPFEVALIPENRDPFLNHLVSDFQPHSKGNLKSSQLMCLDYFLPYLEHPDRLKGALNLDETITSIEFETVFKDYTHGDVLLTTDDDKKILIETKYAESGFSKIDEITDNLRSKFHGTFTSDKHFVKYKLVNMWMDNHKVSMQEFFDNYQLYRNLYNAFNFDRGNPGYMVVIYPRQNEVLDIQYKAFVNELEHKHGFRFMDRVIRLYWEDIVILRPHFTEKYLLLSDRKLNVTMELPDSWEYNSLRRLDHTKVTSWESFMFALEQGKTNFMMELRTDNVDDLHLANDMLEHFRDTHYMTTDHQCDYYDTKETIQFTFLHNRKYEHNPKLNN